MEAKNSYVHPSSYVDEPCSIGAGTKMVISPEVVIGDNVKIQNNVSVYTGVILEDDVFCGPSMVFTNVTNPRSHVARKNEYKRTLVRQGASLGSNSTVVCGVTIGRYAFVGAGSVVTRDVPDYALVYGNPARVRGWMCACGIGIEFTNEAGSAVARCSACGTRYLKNDMQVTVAELVEAKS